MRRDELLLNNKNEIDGLFDKRRQMEIHYMEQSRIGKKSLPKKLMPCACVMRRTIASSRSSWRRTFRR